MSRLFYLPFRRGRARRNRLLTMLLAVLTVLVFLAPFYVIYKPPSGVIAYFQRRWPDVLWRVALPRGEKVVALTIDDAPSRHTREILEVLRENEARATFFVIGEQVEREGGEEVLKEILEGGNELGNHAMRDEPSVSLPPDQLVQELKTVEGYINGTYEAVGMQRAGERYFRPGSGFFNARLRTQVKELGFRIVLGNVYPHDAQIGYPKVNARHILSMVKPGSIIICHDRRSWTMPMLKIVLPELKRRGYQITTVSGLLEAARAV